MKPVSHRELNPDEHIKLTKTIKYFGDEMGDTTWRCVVVKFPDGRESAGWICDSVPGYFQATLTPQFSEFTDEKQIVSAEDILL